jgi:hypothetical protein
MNIHTDAYYASLLNCSLGKLSIKYLEMILHWKKPSKYDWQLIIDKIQLKTFIMKRETIVLRGYISLAQCCFILYPFILYLSLKSLNELSLE